MFDTQVMNNVKVNAVSGTIVKNYKESFMRRFHLKSSLADDLLRDEPSMYNRRKKDNRPVVILQILLCGEGEVIAEIMWKEDFEKLFE